MKRRCILIPYPAFYLPSSPTYCLSPSLVLLLFLGQIGRFFYCFSCRCNERTLQRCPGSHRNNYKTSKPSCIRLRVECSTSQAVAWERAEGRGRGKGGEGSKERGSCYEEATTTTSIKYEKKCAQSFI